MKRLFYVAALAALTFASCEKDTFQPAQPEEPEYGTLLLGDASISVSTETDIKTSRATQGDTYDNYCIWVTRTDGNTEVEVDLDKANTSATHTTYSSVKENGISLPAGTYTLKVQSAASIPNAAFEAPVYTAEKPGIQITAGGETPAGDIVCKLNEQVKVSVSYNDLFADHIAGPGMATVTINSTQSLEYPITYESSKASWKKENGFFKVAPSPATTSMEITVNVLMKVKKEGSTEYETTNQKMTATVTGVAACQWRQIKFAMEKDQNGNASFSVNIGDLEADIPLEVEATTSEDQILGEDPLAPKSDGDIRLLNTAGLNDSTIPTQTAWNGSFTFGDPSFDPADNHVEGTDYSDMDIAAENTARENMVIVIDENLSTEEITTGTGENANTTQQPMLRFQAQVPGGITSFKIKILSDVIAPLLPALGEDVDNELDLINNPAEVGKIASIIPFPYHDPDGTINIGSKEEPIYNKTTVTGAKSLDFVLDGAIPLLQALFGMNEGTLDEVTDRYYHDHTFQMIVSSPNGKKTVDLKLRVYKPQDDNTSSN